MLDVATNDPAVAGFLSGTYNDGSPLYPGVGVFPSCNGNRPARVNRRPSLAFGECSYSDMMTTQGVKFVAAHPNLEWVWTNKSVVEKLSGQIPITMTNGVTNYITRHKLTGFEQIGHYQIVDNVVWYWNGDKSVNSSEDFEVLICKQPPTTTTTSNLSF